MEQDFCVDLGFWAPELLFGSTYYGCEVDIWSLGMLALNFVTTDYSKPEDPESHRAMLFELLGTPDTTEPSSLPNFPPKPTHKDRQGVSAETRGRLGHFWSRVVGERPPMGAVQAHDRSPVLQQLIPQSREASSRNELPIPRAARHPAWICHASRRKCARGSTMAEYRSCNGSRDRGVRSVAIEF